MAVVASALVQAGVRLPFAFLCGFGASAAAFFGIAHLGVLTEEKFGWRTFPGTKDDPGLYGTSLAVVLCIAGSYIVARIVGAIF